ncbi:hypothetical protein CKO11_05450 [Rhodobacter sp. TJ_12]|uniref:DUF6895 family protein n=1 Tax=Rhodobacter sp. TJ_12 TaxID=2029399 RepID=UPI001CC1BF7D|nr:hypothetical protein [Rhodobacter sp. TJ_12]MBZ4021904.1 hypothetical protein [Rhodobacter sp. TJ_12]
MQAILRLAPVLLDALPADGPEATKAVAEVSMALDFLAQVHGPQPGLSALAGQLMHWLGNDTHLALSGHPFLVGRALTPYVFLRALAPKHPAWERLLFDWCDHGIKLCEATPYRRLEQDYLRAKVRGASWPDWEGAAILQDALQAWAFNRDLSYAFTHLVFFCTDFAAVKRPDPFVKGIGMMLLGEALGRTDVDLVWELALCLLTQDLEAAELDEVISAAVEMRKELHDLCDPAEITKGYHPVLVHEILAARLHQHHGRDLYREAAGTRPRLAAIEAFRCALTGKDANAMVAAERALPAEDWSRRMLCQRLHELKRRARDRTLFLRETGGADHDAPLYGEYADQIDALLHATA